MEFTSPTYNLSNSRPEIIELEDLNSQNDQIPNDNSASQNDIGFFSSFRCKISAACAYVKDGITTALQNDKSDYGIIGNRREHKEADRMQFCRIDDNDREIIEHDTENLIPTETETSYRTLSSFKCKLAVIGTVFLLGVGVGVGAAAVYFGLNYSKTKDLSDKKDGSLADKSNFFYDDFSNGKTSVNNVETTPLTLIKFNDTGINTAINLNTKFIENFLESFDSNLIEYQPLQKQAEAFETINNKINQNLNRLAKICPEYGCGEQNILFQRNVIYQDNIELFVAIKDRMVIPKEQSKTLVQEFDDHLRNLIKEHQDQLSDMNAIHQKLGDNKTQIDNFHSTQVNINQDFIEKVAELSVKTLKKNCDDSLSLYKEDADNDHNAEVKYINILEKEFSAAKTQKIESLRAKIAESQSTGDCFFATSQDCDDYIKIAVQSELEEIIKLSFDEKIIKNIEISANGLNDEILIQQSALKTITKLEDSDILRDLPQNKINTNAKKVLAELEEEYIKEQQQLETIIIISHNDYSKSPQLIKSTIADISFFIKNNPELVDDKTRFDATIQEQLEKSINNSYQHIIEGYPKLSGGNSMKIDALVEKSNGVITDFFKACVNKFHYWIIR